MADIEAWLQLIALLKTRLATSFEGNVSLIVGKLRLPNSFFCSVGIL
jgi:hypothetical protein